MVRSSPAFFLMLAFYVGCGPFNQPTYVDAPQAYPIYSAALARAEVEKKPVFIVFTQNEFWCQHLEKYHSENDVARVLDKYFIRVSLPVDSMIGAQQMYLETGGNRGVPAYRIVNHHGDLLASSDDTGHNIGFPNIDDEVESYLEMIKTACPDITAAEQALLRTKLEACRVTNTTTN